MTVLRWLAVGLLWFSIAQAAATAALGIIVLFTVWIDGVLRALESNSSPHMGWLRNLRMARATQRHRNTIDREFRRTDRPDGSVSGVRGYRVIGLVPVGR